MEALRGGDCVITAGRAKALSHVPRQVPLPLPPLACITLTTDRMTDMSQCGEAQMKRNYTRIESAPSIAVAVRLVLRSWRFFFSTSRYSCKQSIC